MRAAVYGYGSDPGGLDLSRVDRGDETSAGFALVG
jgi:hypothetical protein